MKELTSSSPGDKPENHALTVVAPDGPAELMRRATDAAHVSRQIVLATANDIQGRRFVRCEGWMAIAIAHGCALSASLVEVIPGGVRAVGEVRRISDHGLVATAEGFVGEDEPTWYGGESEVWDGPRGNRRKIVKILPKRPNYAIRAMAQTRAMSRAARSAFAHVVVLIDHNLSTTPAEEVPDGGFEEVTSTATRPVETAQALLRLEGVVQSVTTAEGTNSSKTFYNVTLLLADTSTKAFYTSDEKLGATAQEARDDGTPMVVFYRPGKKANTFELVNLDTLENDQAFRATMEDAGNLQHN